MGRPRWLLAPPRHAWKTAGAPLGSQFLNSCGRFNFTEYSGQDTMEAAISALHYTAIIVLMRKKIYKQIKRPIFRAGYFMLGKKIPEFSDKY